MKNEYLVKTLVITIVLAMVIGGMAIFRGMEKAKSEENNKGILPLEIPSFVSMAGASGVTDPSNGVSFLEDEAGISAYVNIGYEIDIGEAQEAFKSIETANETYIIGEINLIGLPEYVDPHVYVHENGWVLAYYSKYTPASKIMYWYGYTGGVITTTTLEQAIAEVCDSIRVIFSSIKDDIQYYNFEYPNANRVMLITERTGTHDSTDSFYLTIPTDCVRYEYSWARYFDYYDDYDTGWAHPYRTADSGLYLHWVDWDPFTDTLHFYNDVRAGDYYTYGYYSADQLGTPGINYQIGITQELRGTEYSRGDEVFAYTYVATVLVYHSY